MISGRASFGRALIYPGRYRPHVKSSANQEPRESTMRRCASFFFSRTRSTAMQTSPCVSPMRVCLCLYICVCVCRYERGNLPRRDLQFEQRYISANSMKRMELTLLYVLSFDFPRFNSIIFDTLLTRGCQRRSHEIFALHICLTRIIFSQSSLFIPSPSLFAFTNNIFLSFPLFAEFLLPR